MLRFADILYVYFYIEHIDILFIYLLNTSNRLFKCIPFFRFYLITIMETVINPPDFVISLSYFCLDTIC